MADWLVIVLIVLALLVLLFAVGGAVARNRRTHAGDAGFQSHLDDVNRQLAAAHAADHGWEPGTLERRAREIFAERRPGTEVRDVQLVAVIDPPGTEADRAVFRFMTAEGSEDLTLARSGDSWSAAP